MTLPDPELIGNPERALQASVLVLRGLLLH
jgi:hypothetical protein